MKSMHVLYSVLMIVLTGETVADFLANNAGVLLLIIAIVIMWYVASKRIDDHVKQENQNL